MEQAVDEHLPGVGAREDLEHLRGLRADPLQPRAVQDRHRRVVAHGEDPPGAVGGHHLGHHHGGVVGQVAGDLRGHARLAREVELLGEPPRELVEQPAAGRAAARAGAGRARQSRPRSSARSRGSEALSQGYCTFTATSRAVGQAGAVDLRDRRGAERAGPRRPGRPARGSFRAPPRRTARTSGNGRGGTESRRVAKAPPHFWGQRVVAQRGELAELGVGALQVPEGGREALGLALASDRAPRRSLGRGDPRRSEGLAETSAEDRGAAAREPDQGDERERAPPVARRDPGRGGGGLRNERRAGRIQGDRTSGRRAGLPGPADLNVRLTSEPRLV